METPACALSAVTFAMKIMMIIIPLFVSHFLFLNSYKVLHSLEKTYIREVYIYTGTYKHSQIPNIKSLMSALYLQE